MVGVNRWKEHSPPLSELSVKAERVSPLSLFEWFENLFSGNAGGNAGVTLVRVFGNGSFFIS